MQLTKKPSVPKQNSITIKTATRLYSKLKKSGLSDVQIRKIAQILSACSMDECQGIINPATGEITYL